MGEQWVVVDGAGEVAPGSLRAARAGERKLVLGRTEAGAPFALDGRCPHEGYPLATGELKGDLLTCAWHNWKFDVTDGRCVLGGEGVRRFPVRERDGRIEIDVAEPPSEATIATARESLLTALRDGDVSRALRDAVRMLAAGAPAADVLVDVCADDALRGEYGTTHALPVAADCARLATNGPAAIRALAHPIELCAEENLRLPPRDKVPPLPVAADDDGASLPEAILAEDEVRARGLLAGAFAAGVERATVERWLARAVASHFTNFGHELIHLVKGAELLDRVDPSRAAEIWPGLVVSLVRATREDTLPYLRTYAGRAGGLAPELERLAAGEGVHHDRAALRAAVLDAPRPADAVDALHRALLSGSAPAEVAKDLVVAAAHRLLRFDEAHDRDPLVAEGWLWATHRLTFAAAVRAATRRFPGETAVRLLFQSVAFTHSGRAMDAPRDRRAAAPSAEAVSAAAADGGALRWRALEESFVRPIFVAHALKTVTVGLDEREALDGDDERDAPLAAALRFLAARPLERTLPAAAERSRRFVVEGELPRKLTQ